ncbi:protein of unknown function [Cyclobacterium xiamenense]|jgi:hypothetical protein|uniref:DUF4412 domain-containing protein n=1 Tax=Cyclobacterium xiamenense TaxID=1297121 RepID=A0A1H6ZBZ4_9BACT|nr:DUF4412 domain-containing protein [Cyclobacterium xiamenense]SEJ46405.1 protein of unknown function [Cyclobacterium xiamenense]
MKFLFSISLFLMLSLIGLDAQAQLLKRLKNAASEGVTRAVERTVEKEVAKATQRQLEKAFSNLYGDMGEVEGGTPGETYDYSKIMSSINMDVETESAYDFSGVAVMEIQSTDEKGKADDPIVFNSLLSENPDYFGMEYIESGNKKSSEKSVIIMDHKNKATVMLMENDEEKSSMAFSIDWGGMMEAVESDPGAESESFDASDITFEKTGNTKDILGYTCEEYRVVSEDTEGNYWISQDPIAGLESFWSKNSPFVTKKMKEENQEYFNNLPKGNILEMDFASKEDQSRSQMKMIEIDTNRANHFELADYPNVMKGAK